MNSPDELRVKQVALKLGIPFTHVTRLIRRGALKASRPGPPGTWTIRQTDLDAYIVARDREAAEQQAQRRQDAADRRTSSRAALSVACEHSGVVGFCGQCDGRWLVQASGITYVFDLDAGMVTVMPGDVDDDEGALPFPQLLMLPQDLGPVGVNSPIEVNAQDPWGETKLINGWISHISRA